MTAVHPRRRGEQSASLANASCPVGSSPRARGTGITLATREPCVRFIPAGAGNSEYRTRDRAGHPVHPRGRGEQRVRKAFAQPDFGSSPRARGTGRIRRIGDDRDRFIPAGAGNRPHVADGLPLSAVHPRGRGEQGMVDAETSIANRFIPAGAGNRPPCSISDQRSSGSSPRARGTARSTGSASGHLFGSSPRARGTDCLEGIGHA